MNHTYSMFPSFHTHFLAHIHHDGSFNAIDFYHTFILGIDDDGFLAPLSSTFQVDVHHGFVSKEKDGIVVSSIGHVRKRKLGAVLSMTSVFESHHVSFTSEQTTCSIQKTVIPYHVFLIISSVELHRFIRVFFSVHNLFDVFNASFLESKRVFVVLSIEGCGL